MKIAFVGTHNSGKTTTLWHVAAALKKRGFSNFKIINEVVRNCPYSMWDKSLNLQTQLWCIMHQILAELDAHHKGLHVITDRCVFDQIVYYKDKVGKQILWLEEPFYPELTLLKELALQWISIQPYTIIFWFRGFKTQTKRRQKRVDRLFDKELDFPNVVEIKGTISERCEKVTKSILEMFENEE